MNTFNDMPDMITVLRALDHGRSQSKRFRVGGDGSLVAQKIRPSLEWAAEILEVNGMRDLLEVLRRVERSSDEVIVRGVPVFGANMERMRRSTTTRRGQDATLEEVDHHWVCIDLDKVPMPDSLDLADRSTWSASVAELVTALLPPCFADVACIFQWSSSAGVRDDGKISLHLWYWSDRPVCSSALHVWAMGQEHVDAAMMRDAQPHFVARPQFDDASTDPLPGSRLGYLKGSRPTLALPSDVMDLEDWTAKLEAERQARAEESKRRHERMVRNGLRTDGEHKEELLADALTFINADDHEVWILVGAALHHSARVDGVDGRGLWDQWSMSSSTYDVKDSDKRWASFTESGSKKGTVTAGSLFHLAKQAGWRSPSQKRREERMSNKQRRRLGRERTEQAPKATTQAATTEGAPEMTLSIDGLGLLLDTIRDEEQRLEMAELEARAAEVVNCFDVSGAREVMSQMAARVFSKPGVVLVKAPPGTGKSRALLRQAAQMARAEPDGRPIAVIVPSHKLAAETVNLLREMAPDVWTDAVTTRTEHNCSEHDMMAAIGKICPHLAKRFCRACPRHPSNADPQDICNYMDRLSSNGARILVLTHSLWHKIGEQLEEDDIPAHVIYDESPLGECIPDSEVGHGQLAELIGSGRLYSRSMVDISAITGEERDKCVAATEAVMRLMTWSQTEGNVVNSDQMSTIFPGALDFEDDESYTEHVWEEGERCATRDAQLARFQRAATKVSRLSLRDSIDRDWIGAAIHGGTLKMATVLPLPINTTGSFAVLDATAERDFLDAATGQECRVEEINVPMPDHVKVTRVMSGFTARDHLADDNSPSRVQRLALGATLKHYGGDDTLFICSKSFLKEGSDIERLIKTAHSGPTIHHGSAEARGSNAYKTMSKVVITEHHLPRNVIDRRADVLAHLLGADTADEEQRAHYRAMSKRQFQDAQHIQELCRVRPLDATPDDPCHIIICSNDENAPQRFALGEADHVVCPRELIWPELGVETTEGVDDVVVAAAKAMRVMAPTKVARDISGALTWEDLTPEIGPLGWAIRSVIDSNSRSAESTPADLPFDSSTPQTQQTRRPPAEWICDQVRNHYDGDWTLGGLLEIQGVQTTLVHPRGHGVGKAFPLWVAPEMSTRPHDLVWHIERIINGTGGATAWRLEGYDEWQLITRLRRELVDALTAIPSPENYEGGLRAWFKALGEKLGGISGQRAERLLLMNRPAEGSRLDHAHTAWLDACTERAADLVENAHDEAQMEAYRTAEAEGRDPATEPVEPYFQPRLDALRAQYAAEVGTPLRPSREAPLLTVAPDVS